MTNKKVAMTPRPGNSKLKALNPKEVQKLNIKSQNDKL
jgi:hypothetical protein